MWELLFILSHNSTLTNYALSTYKEAGHEPCLLSLFVAAIFWLHQYPLHRTSKLYCMQHPHAFHSLPFHHIPSKTLAESCTYSMLACLGPGSRGQQFPRLMTDHSIAGPMDFVGAVDNGISLQLQPILLQMSRCKWSIIGATNYGKLQIPQLTVFFRSCGSLYCVGAVADPNLQKAGSTLFRRSCGQRYIVIAVPIIVVQVL